MSGSSALGSTSSTGKFGVVPQLNTFSFELSHLRHLHRDFHLYLLPLYRIEFESWCFLILLKPFALSCFWPGFHVSFGDVCFVYLNCCLLIFVVMQLKLHIAMFVLNEYPTYVITSDHLVII